MGISVDLDMHILSLWLFIPTSMVFGLIKPLYGSYVSCLNDFSTIKTALSSLLPIFIYVTESVYLVFKQWGNKENTHTHGLIYSSPTLLLCGCDKCMNVKETRIYKLRLNRLKR